MGLLDDIKAAGKHQGCPIGEMMKQLRPQDQKDLQTAFADACISSAAIRNVLNKRGVYPPIGRDSLLKHRKGDCVCEKAT